MLLSIIVNLEFIDKSILVNKSLNHSLEISTLSWLWVPVRVKVEQTGLPIVPGECSEMFLDHSHIEVYKFTLVDITDMLVQWTVIILSE